MALLKAGYWQTTYWPSNYWQEDYWPEYGTATPPVVLPPVSIGFPSRRKPKKLPLEVDEADALALIFMLRRKKHNA
jgi:hypothetical protein